MSSITTEQGILHYEVYGRGRPVILLHGWLGSWGLWQETMAYLGRYYRTYALDFWGFGESGKKRSTYAVDDFVAMVGQFMDQLGIVRAPLVGHSMGGTVSLKVALENPTKVSCVTVIGSPIDGESLAWALKMAGYRSIAFMVYNMMWALKLGLRIAAPTITRDKRWTQMIYNDLSRTTLESFLISIASLRRTNLIPRLHEIQVPVMGMYGLLDNIVHPNQWKPICQHAPYPRIERFEESGHFVMLDESERFMHTLKDFLDENVSRPRRVA
ncbi:MAG: alpha/beta hydrolase [Anaerolineae bacterium]|nr:MAG: alpha/beta hydrolase [Anaerolineae bacterium]